MKTIPFRIKFLAVILAAVFVLGNSRSLSAKQNKDASLDIVVKISRLDQTLNLIDDLIRPDTGPPAISLGTLLRGILHGTDWIDPNRLIILGIILKEPQPEMAVLIPFKQPNPNFQAAFNASAGPDYYLLALPPGQPVNASLLENEMAAASKSKSKSFLSIELSVSRILKKHDSQIQELLSRLKNQPLEPEGKNLPFDPQDIHAMVLKILETAADLKNFAIRLNLDKIRLTAAMEAEAVKGSELARLFTRDNRPIILNGYKPHLQINFRSQRYHMDGILDLIANTFGKFYERMGIDFFSLAKIGKKFTGEMAGGISFGPNGIRFEMINVLKSTGSPKDFLESVYMPWLMDFNQKMVNLLKTQLGEAVQPVFLRTANSTVAGHKVIGIRTQMPGFPSIRKDAGMEVSKGLLKYDVRMTTVGNLVLTAPDDKRINELIKITKRLRKSPAKGPLMLIDYDITGYLGAIMEMIPGLEGQRPPLPKMGRVTLWMDMENGRAYSRSSISTQDIKTCIGYFKNLSPLPRQPKPVIKSTYQKPIEKKSPEKKQKKEPMVKISPKDAAFWIHKGVRNATYGNDAAAVRHFKKAIAIDPDNSDAHFQQGISYGEIGDYKQAIVSINRAIELNPQSGRYFYGRGRVFLLSGQKSKAIDDFKHAATLGDPDARTYLKKRSIQTAGN